jgi:metal-responsive CopG/Arc/MetJ family transcriptional regulator
METIQVVLDSALLRATNGAAKRARINRSALIRNALREYLNRLNVREKEARDRQGYEQRPDTWDSTWERVQSWPSE